MLLPALSLATLALQVAAPLQVADPEPPVARTLPADSTWEQGQGGARATDSVRGWDLAVSERGLRVSPADAASDTEEQPWSFLIGTASFGRVGAAQAVTLGQPNARGERVDLDHGPLSEWFVRGEHGVEHGWTIPSAPEGDAKVPLWIGLRVEGDLSMHIVDDGSGAFLRDARGVLKLRYGYLKTYDATGAVIPSRMSPSSWGVGIQIDASSAQYPITVDPVVVPPAWELEFNQANLISVWQNIRGAGDVNGDGFSDVVVALGSWDEGANVDEGEVRVYYGGGVGPSLVPDWVGKGGTAGVKFGRDAVSAGDLNGDKFDDLAIVSDGLVNSALYVYFGGPGGLGAMGTPANADFTYQHTGSAYLNNLSPVGDVDDDGYDDLALQANDTVSGLPNAGRAYVFFGGPTGIVLGPQNPWSAAPDPQADLKFGERLSAGTVNDDRSPDLMISTFWYDDSGYPDAGRAYLYFGGSGFRTKLSPDQVLVPPVLQTSQNWGGGGVVGDLNGDGYADAFLSASAHDNGQFDEGKGWIYNGGPGGLTLTGLSIESNRVSGWLGGADRVGDVDGDGYADLFTGSPFGAVPTGPMLYFGGPNGISPTPTGDQQLPNEQAGSGHGTNLGGAGDVNNDGFMDVTSMANTWSNGQTNEGKAYIYFGSPNPQPGTTHVLMAPGPLQAGPASSLAGRSLSSAGDVNADGYNDVVIGSPEFGATDNGRVQVFLGGPNGLNLSSPFWTFESPNNGERFGWSVSAGDLDNDGKSDIVVGAPRYASGQIDEGRVYLFKSNGTSIAATPTWSFESNEAGALLGSSLSALGDVNADGYSDIAVGAPGAGSGQGGVTLFHGRATGLSSLPVALAITSGLPGSEFGASVALVGDVNLDGFGDLAVGAPRVDNPQVDEGRVYVYLGSYQGITTSAPADYEGNIAGELFGASVAACGDINGDGRAEILVGGPGYDPASSGGRIFILQTATLGMGISLSTQSLRTGLQANSQFGFAVSAAGDVNGDGWNDILVGAPEYDGTLSNQGRIYLYLGSSLGLASSPSETYDGPLANARLGQAIALGGDVNGDGFSDPIGGVPSANGGGGGVMSLTANSQTSWRAAPQQRQINDLQAVNILGRVTETNQFQLNVGLQNAVGNTATAVGRAPVRLEWELMPQGLTFNGLAVQAQPAWSDSGPLSSSTQLIQGLTSLVPGTAYHWRTRTAVRDPYYPHTRWVTLQLNGLQEKKLGLSADCNNNGLGDQIDIQNATSLDCNGNTFPDECEVLPLANPDVALPDCNQNLVPDACEYDPLFDCDSNGVMDECQLPPFGNQDCNGNSVVDTCDIATSFSVDTNLDGIPDECQPGGSTFCFGDGTGAACPCANSSPAGNQDGCLNSLGVGGRLRASGIARVAFDNFTLLGTGMPNSSALYFQGTAQQSTGNGAPFGDGKRCAAGTIVRLGTKNNTGGGSQYPVGADLRISLKGLIPGGGGTRYYQIWYRNAAAFCTVSTFNLTNGWQVTWIP